MRVLSEPLKPILQSGVYFPERELLLGASIDRQLHEYRQRLGRPSAIGRVR